VTLKLTDALPPGNSATTVPVSVRVFQPGGQLELQSRRRVLRHLGPHAGVNAKRASATVASFIRIHDFIWSNHMQYCWRG
jgi:hypothetical protein